MLDAALAFLVTRSSPTTRSAATCRASRAIARRAGCRRPTCSRSRAATSCSPSTTRSSSPRLPRRSAMPDLPKDPRFVDWPARIANDAALRAIIEEVFACDDDKTWEARLTKADVPCSRVWTHPRDRRPSAARPPRRAAARRDALRPDDAGRLGLPAGARRRQRRAARRRCRAQHAEEILARGRLRRERDRGAAPRRGDLIANVIPAP